jgi:dimethylaniline monooxygenase (N-oxide forming)
VFKGLCTLPSKEEMTNDIKRKAREVSTRYRESPRHTIQVDFISYLDELANMIGCRPNISIIMIFSAFCL